MIYEWMIVGENYDEIVIKINIYKRLKTTSGLVVWTLIFAFWNALF